jgi:hypothetical protein
MPRLNAFTGTTAPVTFKERPADVMVLREGELTRWLKRRRATLGLTERERLATAVIRRETWMPEPAVSAPHEAAEFEALQREVAQAHRVRRFWSAGALIAGIGIAAPWQATPTTASSPRSSGAEWTGKERAHGAPEATPLSRLAPPSAGCA